MAFWTRFVTTRRRSAPERTACVASPVTSSVIWRCSARGSSVSAASSAIRDRSTASRVKFLRSPRLSSRRASVRSIARVLTTWRRSRSSPGRARGRCGRRPGVSARSPAGCGSFMGGVRGEPLLFGDVGFELPEHGVEHVGEFAEFVLRPSMLIRWDSDPFAAIRAASAIRVSGASIRPARIHPPTRPNTSRKASAWAARGRRRAADRSGWGRTARQAPHACRPRPGHDRAVGYVAQQETQTTASSRAPARIRNPA